MLGAWADATRRVDDSALFLFSISSASNPPHLVGALSAFDFYAGGWYPGDEPARLLGPLLVRSDMPPKRKRRPPSQAASTPAGNTAEDVVKTDAQSKEASERMSLQDDPWTDEQETALFKGMIRWKPVGLFPLLPDWSTFVHLRR